jgi:hypothetical protein
VSGPASITVVEFAMAGARFAVPAQAVAAMGPAQTDDGTMETLIGLPVESQGRLRVLTLRLNGGTARVSLAAEPTIRELAADAILAVPDLVRARTHIRGLAALALDGDGVLLVIDPARI